MTEENGGVEVDTLDDAGRENVLRSAPDLFGESEIAAEAKPATFDPTAGIEATDGTKSTPMPEKPAKAKAVEGPSVAGGDGVPVYARKRVWIVRGNLVAELRAVSGKVAKVFPGTGPGSGSVKDRVSIRLDDKDAAGESVVLDREPERVYSSESRALVAAAACMRDNIDKLMDAHAALLLRAAGILK